MGFCERLTALLKEKKIDKNVFCRTVGLDATLLATGKKVKKGIQLPQC